MSKEDPPATDIEEIAPCMCHGFVAADKRIDFLELRPHHKTGKPYWKVIVRQHKDCPEHGINPCLVV